MARLDPYNRMGGSAEDLLSGNYDWSLPILSLKGRAGLDLGLSLTYNSLDTWVKSGSYIKFEPDYSFPGPGFHLGFPTIEGTYYNDQAGAYFYLLVTPSGQNVELRRIDNSSTYEAMDSSYLQLIDEGSQLVLRSGDGSQMTYVAWTTGEYRCTQVKDSNGNYITINNNSLGDITSIIDTLGGSGRTITFNYDSYHNLTSITQPWHQDIQGQSQSSETHQWATFGYTSKYIGTNFSNMTVSGPVNQNITVLSQVGLADGSQYSFDYNDYGQVNKITRKTLGGGTLNLSNYVSYDFTSSSSDCPRINARHDMAAQWNNDQPVTTTFGTDNGARTMTTPAYGPSGISLIYKEYYGSSTTWQKGLLTQAEWWYGGAKQKYTTTQWTQDNINTGVNYLTNPRLVETNIYDTSVSPNRQLRTGYGYYSYTRPSNSTVTLKSDQYDYLDPTTAYYRRVHFGWQLDSGYLSRGFTGLLHSIDVYDHTNGTDVLKARTSFWYDYGGTYLVATTSPDTPTQHDPSYDFSYPWRGNVALTLRHDADDPDNNYSQVSTSYNTTGSVVSVSRQHTSTQWNTTTINYADSFSDGANHNTFAYPTTTTDADSNNATAQYNFEMGVIYRVQGPPPANPSNSNQPYSQWAALKTYRDQAGRPIRQVNEFNSAYRSFYYDYNYVLSWASINNVADEALSLQYFDGHGRLFAALTNHPGSTGGYIGQWTIYDVLGRMTNQSTPTEINGSWQAVGDDATSDGSFPRWIQQTYDWKSRPLVTTNTDGAQKSASYDGCGCAGAVVTVEDEVGRTQKIYSDVLGRTTKTESYNGSSVYATTTNTYNARDQITQITEYSGAEGSGTHQDTTMTYDGFGRLWKRHAPEQQVDSTNSASTDHTTWVYNFDDTNQAVTDARGVVTNFGYNHRNLVTSIAFDRSQLPTSVIVPTVLPFSFSYDAAGNRMSATQQDSNQNVFGSNYQYDQLSRLTSEIYHFADITGSYALNYTYNLASEPTSLAIPLTTQTIGYSYDNAGRLNSMSASGFLASYTTPWPDSQTHTQSLTSFIVSVR
jgi:YD repeat-containing protein